MSASPPEMSLEDRARRIRLVLFDVDGVLTDGVVVMHADGSESKGFHIKDGAAIVWAQRAGVQVGLLSARSSGATTHRAAQLAIRIVQQGVTSKASAFDTILKSSGLTEDAVCYMGDDLLDLPVLERAGLSAPLLTPRGRCASGCTGSARQQAGAAPRAN